MGPSATLESSKVFCLPVKIALTTELIEFSISLNYYINNIPQLVDPRGLGRECQLLLEYYFFYYKVKNPDSLDYLLVSGQKAPCCVKTVFFLDFIIHSSKLK